MQIEEIDGSVAKEDHEAHSNEICAHMGSSSRPSALTLPWPTPLREAPAMRSLYMGRRFPLHPVKQLKEAELWVIGSP